MRLRHEIASLQSLREGVRVAFRMARALATGALAAGAMIVTMIVVMIATGGIAYAGSAHAGFPMRVTEVASAMGVRGISVDASQVTMLAQVVAASDHPALVVASLSRWDDVRNKAKLSCRSGAECLPFYVFVTWPDKASAAEALEAFRRSACLEIACAGAAGLTPARAPALSTNAASASSGEKAGEAFQSKSHAAPPSGVTLRAGTHAMLVIDADGLHIRVPVTCLENGLPGKRIRVEARDRKQTYFAEVLADASLKGTL
jgi:hypothetical protein